MADSKTKNKIYEYLRTQILMALATADKKGNLWNATVYFAADSDLNLYFISAPHALHCLNISVNPKVAVSIADSRQKPSGEKIGLQASGKCVHVAGKKEQEEILAIWNKKFVDKPFKFTESHSPFYKITLEKIKLFDTKTADKTLEWSRI